MGAIKKITLSAFLLVLIHFSWAQNSFRGKFKQANKLTLAKHYKSALPIWLSLYKREKDSVNANVNYKIGLCYMMTVLDTRKAIPFLEKAVKRTKRNYDIVNPGEKKAPVESNYYLAKAYYMNYQFDKAEEYYDIFFRETTLNNHLYKPAVYDTTCLHFAEYAVKHPVKVKVNNLGNTINSKYPDYNPVLTLDQSTLYFTSQRPRSDSSYYTIVELNDSTYFADIYQSDKINGQWSKPKLVENINSPQNEKVLNISLDNRTLLLSRNKDIYTSKYDEGEWRKPQKIISDINSPNEETGAALTPDGKQLYFVSNRKGGYGLTDIWFCNKMPDGKWGVPQNVGKNINTKYDEVSVFIGSDGTMYFSSDGHLGMGGYDIYYTKKGADGTWQKPVDMGYPINSVLDDLSFTNSISGQTAYITSNRINGGFGNEDIFIVNYLNNNKTPLTLLTVNISVKEKKILPDNTQIKITDKKTGKLIGTYKPRHNDGLFSYVLYPSDDYNFRYTGGGDTTNEEMKMALTAPFKEIKKKIILQKPREKTQIYGILEADNIPLDSVNIQLLTQNNNLISKVMTDSAGRFHFSKLLVGNNYLLKIDTTKKAITGDTKIYFANSKWQKVLAVNKLNMFLFGFKALPMIEYNKLPIINVASSDQLLTIPLYGQIYRKLPGDFNKRLKVYIIGDSGKLIAETYTDENGKFSFDKLPPEKMYHIKIEPFIKGLKMIILDEKGKLIASAKLTRLLEYDYVRLKSVKNQIRLLNEKDEVITISADENFTISDIYYDYNKYNLNLMASNQLDKLVVIMKKNPQIKVMIKSYTDSRGSDSYNLKLSEKRAETAVQYIINKGINADRLTGKGFGEADPVNNCKNGVPCTEEEYAKNRRTEVQIMAVHK